MCYNKDGFGGQDTAEHESQVSVAYQSDNLWSTPRDASTVSQASHVLTISATDATKRTSMRLINVMSNAADAVSSVVLDSTPKGETFNRMVKVSGLVSDNDGLRAMRIYIDGTLNTEVQLQGISSNFE